jgi:hypothetical protein
MSRHPPTYTLMPVAYHPYMAASVPAVQRQGRFYLATSNQGALDWYTPHALPQPKLPPVNDDDLRILENIIANLNHIFETKTIITTGPFYVKLMELQTDLMTRYPI